MKNSYKLFSVVLAALTLGAVACTEKNEPYQVPEAETGAQFYFATTTPTSYKITPTVESFQIPVYRAAKEVAANAKVTVTDTSKTVFAEGSKVFDLAFAAGQNSVEVTSSVSPWKSPNRPLSMLLPPSRLRFPSRNPGRAWARPVSSMTVSSWPIP